jgi:hypothetical protein
MYLFRGYGILRRIQIRIQIQSISRVWLPKISKKLQAKKKKPSALKREHPALQYMKFLNCLLFLWVILPSWMRIRILDADTVPLTRIRNTGSEQLICVADTGQKLLLEDEMEELVEVQNKYERERRTRMMLEEKVR